MHTDTNTTRKQTLTELYKKAFPVVARHVSKMGGSFDEAKDVFHDALINWYEKSAEGKLTAQNDIAYIVGTAKLMWLKKYREDSHNVRLDNMDVAEDVYSKTSSGRLLNFLERAGKKCMDLLTGFYYDQLPLTEIAGKFGYSGVRSATVQKYKCLEKIRGAIKEKALTYDDLVD